MICFTFSYPSHLKHLVLRAFSEDCLPEMLSKLGVLAERSTKKSKTTSSDSSGGTGRLWRSGSALGGSGGARGRPWESSAARIIDSGAGIYDSGTGIYDLGAGIYDSGA